MYPGHIPCAAQLLAQLVGYAKEEVLRHPQVFKKAQQGRKIEPMQHEKKLDLFRAVIKEKPALCVALLALLPIQLTL